MLKLLALALFLMLGEPVVLMPLIFATFLSLIVFLVFDATTWIMHGHAKAPENMMIEQNIKDKCVRIYNSVWAGSLLISLLCMVGLAVISSRNGLTSKADAFLKTAVSGSAVFEVSLFIMTKRMIKNSKK